MIDRINSFLLYTRGVNTFSTRYESSFPTSVSKWLNIPIGETTIEIPSVLFGHLYSVLRKKATSMMVPLVPDPRITARRLVRGALIDFLSATSRGRIQGVHMSNGITYYGMPGIIFDENMNLLLMTTITLERTGSLSVAAQRLNCRVSPKVFEHQDRIIEKTIVKKMIPFCANYLVQRYDLTTSVAGALVEITDSCINNVIRVIIDDCSSFVHTAVAPSPSDLTEEKIKAFLNANMNYIVE